MKHSIVSLTKTHAEKCKDRLDGAQKLFKLAFAELDGACKDPRICSLVNDAGIFRDDLPGELKAILIGLQAEEDAIQAEEDARYAPVRSPAISVAAST
jgi:hypothetical protein